MWQRIKDQFFDIRRHEWPTVLLMSTFFFMVITTFWVLKPMKRGLIVNFYQESPLILFGQSFAGAEVEQLAKIVNMLVVYLLAVLFTYLSSRFRRHHMNLILCLLFGGLFLGFARIIDDPAAGTVWGFYVLGDMFNSAMVIFFWAFSNDIFSAGQAKRTYGLVGLGGILGGIAGARLVVGYVSEFGHAVMLYICLIPLAALVIIGYIVHHWNKKPVRADEMDTSNGNESHPVYEGARLVFKSNYLLAIAGIIGLYEVVSNIVDFQLSATIATTISGGLEKDVYFGYVGLITNILSLIVQLFFTSYVMTRYGVGIALMFLPVAISFGAAGFLVLPGLIFATVMSAGDNSFNYSINQSAKETLYTPTSRDYKYKAKAFIDMFVQRFAKVLAVVLNLGVAAYVGIANVRWLSVATLIILVIWIAIVRYAGSEFRRLSERGFESGGNF